MDISAGTSQGSAGDTVTLADMIEECPPHHWILGQPAKGVIEAVCKKCDKTKTYNPRSNNKWKGRDVTVVGKEG